MSSLKISQLCLFLRNSFATKIRPLFPLSWWKLDWIEWPGCPGRKHFKHVHRGDARGSASYPVGALNPHSPDYCIPSANCLLKTFIISLCRKRLALILAGKAAGAGLPSPRSTSIEDSRQIDQPRKTEGRLARNGSLKWCLKNSALLHKRLTEACTG